MVEVLEQIKDVLADIRDELKLQRLAVEKARKEMATTQPVIPAHLNDLVNQLSTIMTQRMEKYGPVAHRK